MYKKTLDSTIKFRKEFSKTLLVAITAALGFLVALSWRTPLQKTMDQLIIKLNLSEQAVYIEYLSALIITLVAVLILMFISKWKIKGEIS